MPAIANTTSISANPSALGGVVDVSVNRASGEGLLVGIFFGYGFGVPDEISSVVWDPAGDNQSMTLVRRQENNTIRRVSVYYLPAPTSVKTGNVRITFAGSLNDLCHVIVRHLTDPGVVRGNEGFSEAYGAGTPSINHSIASAVGDLVVDFVGHRAEASSAVAAGGQGNVVVQPTSGAGYIASSSKAGDTSVSMGWSATDIADFDASHVLVSIQPAAAPGNVSGAGAITLPQLTVAGVGTVGTVTRYWMVPTDAPDGTEAEIIIFSADRNSVEQRGVAMAADGFFVLECEDQELEEGTKRLCAAHDWDEDPDNTDFDGGLALTTVGTPG